MITCCVLKASFLVSLMWVFFEVLVCAFVCVFEGFGTRRQEVFEVNWCVSKGVFGLV